MELTIEIVARGEAPPAGSAVRVEIRDAGLQDAGAATVAEAGTRTRHCEEGEPFAAATVELPANRGSNAIVWVHVDVDGSGDVTVGDYITMQSYPARGDRMRVEVRRVES
jgi:hypothetical protein